MLGTDPIYWQAHRGGGAHEAPDNTMAANRYAWGMGGIPEADIRTTADGVIICLHDKTLARTTNAPESVRNRSVDELTFEEIRQWDAGVKFDSRFAGEKVPSLEELFVELKDRPTYHVYLDLKKVDLSQLGQLIDLYDVHHQVIFTHNKQENCLKMKEIAQGVRSMLWIGGDAAQIIEKFHVACENKFHGLDQVQLHLNFDESDPSWPYAINKPFLKLALAQTKEAGVDLEVFPFLFNDHSISELLQLGIRWFATDEPAKLVKSISAHSQ